MPESELYIVSIHDEEAERPVLAIDLQHIVAALAPFCQEWIFCVVDLDAVGPGASGLCAEVDAAGGHGVWLSSVELGARVAGLEQTIDGTVLAFPKDTDVPAVSLTELELNRFPSSRAVAAIVAVDGSYFEVYAKQSRVAELLRCTFRDVRQHDPADYFV
jgi:hypothetical protein